MSTRAVCPLPHAHFDPKKYRPERDWQNQKLCRRVQEVTQTKSRCKNGAGWLPGGTCSPAQDRGALQVTSAGADPYLSYQLSEARKQQPLRLTTKVGQLLYRYKP